MNYRDRRRAFGKKAGLPRHPPVANDPAALCEKAARHLRSKRNLDAETCCKQALAIDPNYADALHLLGLLSLADNRPDLAVERIASAIRQTPKAEYLADLGTALQRQGRYEEAVKAVEKAIQLKHDDANLWTKLGAALEEAKRLSEALLCFQHALKLDPRNLEAAYSSAPLLHQSGQLEEALAHFNLCDELRPGHPHTLGMRSLVFRDLKRFDGYLADTLRALALAPKSFELCLNAGDALMLLHRSEEALIWFDRALDDNPFSIFALEGKGKALRSLHRFTELFATYEQIKAIDPTNAKAEFNSANDHLLLGNFEAGWKGREARWRLSDLPNYFPDGPEPIWLGEGCVNGKTILLYSDEGLGDAIQFTRYVPKLAERGARVVLVVQEALLPLLSTLPGLSHCLPTSVEGSPAVDLRCPIMSLPLAFGTTLDTIPPPVPLSPSANQANAWETRLGPHIRPRVGLTWSGNPAHPNDYDRSIPLQLLTSILDIDVTFVSLQKDPRPEDQSILEQTTIVDLTTHLTDFSETAALMSCLDLVITVDTSIAHLAGAMGCRTWILLPYLPDYRWMLNREDSPWYPTARLFRKASAGGYQEVIARLRTELSRFASEFKQPESVDP